MIKTEILNDRIHTYSDTGHKIKQIETNILYDDAIDIIPCPYTYEETDVFVEQTVENSAENLLQIILGGDII